MTTPKNGKGSREHIYGAKSGERQIIHINCGADANAVYSMCEEWYGIRRYGGSVSVCILEMGISRMKKHCKPHSVAGKKLSCVCECACMHRYVCVCVVRVKAFACPWMHAN